jgi:predicted nuclease with TOPRIM domain
MNDAATIQELSERLERVEVEIVAIREKLKTLPEHPDHSSSINELAPDNWIDKTALRKEMRQLFLESSIQGEAVGAEALQALMREAELTTNELSQSIIAAREE